MPLGLITAQAVPGNAGVILMARLIGQFWALVTQASLASIAYQVTDLTVPGTYTTIVSLGNGTIPVSTSIFDSLQQQDQTWTKDSAANPAPPPPQGDGRYGYNFRFVLPPSSVPGGKRLQVDVVFTPVAGQPFRVQFQFTTLPTYGS